MTLLTALEIAANPTDLRIAIGTDAKEEAWEFSISRGPASNLKPLLETRCRHQSRGIVLRSLRAVLEMIRRRTKKAGGSLSKKKISRIMGRFRKKDLAETYRGDFFEKKRKK